ncbi:MAG: twin-arginine translocase TatA/TatE family subunit [Mariprofundus sp.]|nr:twin-arginine translocase TatA/TatE family subunit [Mariprofundus sp.]
MMFGLGTTELILILVIVMVLFGAKKLPALGEGLARGIKSFRTNISDDDKDSVALSEKNESKPVS